MASLFRTVPFKIPSVFVRNKQELCRKKKNYVIVRPVPTDYDDILCLMRRAFYPEEPTTSCIAFQPTPVFDERIRHSLAEGYSLIARCIYNSDILGAAINETTNCWDPDQMDKLACQVCDVKSRQLLHFWAHLMRAPDLWRKHCQQKIFEISYLFVRKDSRGKGIGLKLAEESRKTAADCGYHLVRMDATSHYSALIANKMKMKLVDEIPYCSYVGPDHKQIFDPPEPHKSVKIYIDDEPQKSAACKK